MEFSNQESYRVNKPYIFASFWKRVVAEIIDVIIFSFVNFILLGFYFFKDLSLNNVNYETLAASPDFIKFSILSTFINVFHFTLMESSRIQATAGKSIMKIVVANVDGEKLEFTQAFIRNLAKIFFSLLGFIPLFAPYSSTLGLMYIGSCLLVIWDINKQALHDKVSKTFVFEKNTNE